MQAIMKAGSSSHDHLGVGVLQPRGAKYQPILNGDLFFELPGLTSVSATFTLTFLRAGVRCSLGSNVNTCTPLFQAFKPEFGYSSRA